MEFIVQKIGMSRTISVSSIAVTLLKVIDTKVCEVDENGIAIVAYPSGKKLNKAIKGKQKKYTLSKEFNRFASLEVSNKEIGNLNLDALENGVVVKTSFNTKGRGFTGVMKRWNFSGGPATHGSRFHRRVGSIGNAEWPGRVMPGRKMPGQYGNAKNTVKNEIVSFDNKSNILVLKGSVSGPNGALGQIRIDK